MTRAALPAGHGPGWAPALAWAWSFPGPRRSMLQVAAACGIGLGSSWVLMAASSGPAPLRGRRRGGANPARCRRCRGGVVRSGPGPPPVRARGCRRSPLRAAPSRVSPGRQRLAPGVRWLPVTAMQFRASVQTPGACRAESGGVAWFIARPVLPRGRRALGLVCLGPREVPCGVRARNVRRTSPTGWHRACAGLPAQRRKPGGRLPGPLSPIPPPPAWPRGLTVAEGAPKRVRRPGPCRAGHVIREHGTPAQPGPAAGGRWLAGPRAGADRRRVGRDRRESPVTGAVWRGMPGPPGPIPKPVRTAPVGRETWEQRQSSRVWQGPAAKDG